MHVSCGPDLDLYTKDIRTSWQKITSRGTRPGTARNKRPRVLGDHPRHLLGTLGRLERLGTAWNGTLALRDASVGGQQAGRSKSASVADSKNRDRKF